MTEPASGMAAWSQWSQARVFLARTIRYAIRHGLVVGGYPLALAVSANVPDHGLQGVSSVVADLRRGTSPGGVALAQMLADLAETARSNDRKQHAENSASLSAKAARLRDAARKALSALSVPSQSAVLVRCDGEPRGGLILREGKTFMEVGAGGEAIRLTFRRGASRSVSDQGWSVDRLVDLVPREDGSGS